LPTLKEIASQLHGIAGWVDDLERKLAGLGSHLGGPSTATGKRRGRPPGSKSARATLSAAGPIVRRKRGRRGALGNEIVAFLKSAKSPMLPKAIREALKANPTSISTTLNRLAKVGTVKRNKDGKGWTA
jgi:hypothetical protein